MQVIAIGVCRIPQKLEVCTIRNIPIKTTGAKRFPVDEIFNPGFGFLCWTSEVRNKVHAVRFGYRRGVTTFDDAYRTSRGASRLVRDILKEDDLL